MEVKELHTISRSFAKSEYHAIAAIVCELTWLCYLLNDLYIIIMAPNKESLIAANITSKESIKIENLIEKESTTADQISEHPHLL